MCCIKEKCSLRVGEREGTVGVSPRVTVHATPTLAQLSLNSYSIEEKSHVTIS